jgi:hypothetical protein
MNMLAILQSDVFRDKRKNPTFARLNRLRARVCIKQIIMRHSIASFARPATGVMAAPVAAPPVVAPPFNL